LEPWVEFVAISSARAKLGADHAARARTRVRDHRLAHAFGELLPEQAGKEIRLRARRLGDDDAHRLHRIGLP
jgi:hypothetical protein